MASENTTGNQTGKAAVAELRREITELVEGLETKLDRLSEMATDEGKEVSDEIGDFVAETIASVTERSPARETASRSGP